MGHVSYYVGQIMWVTFSDKHILKKGFFNSGSNVRIRFNWVVLSVLGHIQWVIFSGSCFLHQIMWVTFGGS